MLVTGVPGLGKHAPGTESSMTAKLITIRIKALSQAYHGTAQYHVVRKLLVDQCFGYFSGYAERALRTANRRKKT